MKEKLIKLLEKQIAKLEEEDFDLEAWKSSAISVLSRVFEKNDPRAQQIDELRIDYSSWMLRDSNSKYKPIEHAKRKGKEIMRTAVEEIEIFGLGDKESVLKQYLNSEEIEILSSDTSDKHKLEALKRLKKEDLQKLVVSLVDSIF